MTDSSPLLSCPVLMGSQLCFLFPLRLNPHVSHLFHPLPPAGNSKQALRCKTCKIAAHLWCTSELSRQACHGKVRRTPAECDASVRAPPGGGMLLLQLGKVSAGRELFLLKDFTGFTFQSAPDPPPLSSTATAAAAAVK